MLVVWVQLLADCPAVWEVCSVQGFRAARRAVSPTQGLCPFSHKLLASLEHPAVSWLSPHKAKSRNRPAQLALTRSDVTPRTKVPQGAQESWGRPRGSQRQQKVAAEEGQEFWECSAEGFTASTALTTTVLTKARHKWL